MGLEYVEMQSQCNETVRNANPTRYPTSFLSNPVLADLRCPADVEQWREAVEEAQTHQAASRQRFSEFAKETDNSLND